jgi:hypothetical protein
MDYEVLSQSAERRLLEFRRRELGAAPLSFVTNASWSRERRSPASFTAAPAATIDRAGARLDVALTAWPAEGLVPGAVVTVTVVISNEGIEIADGIVVVAPAPSGTRYRPGTLKLDGRDAESSADALFGEGLQLNKVVAAARTALTWKLDVLPGAADPVFAPTVRAGVPVVGARPLVLRRGKMNSAFRSDFVDAAAVPVPNVPTTHEDVEQPFYELTPEEEIVETAVLTAISTTPPPVLIEESAPPAAEAVAAPAQPVLYRTIRPGDATFVERLLESSLGLLPHFVFANSLAVATTGDGADPLGIAAFCDREGAVLGKLKVAARLSKPLGLDDAAGSAPAIEGDASTISFVDPPSKRPAGAALLRATIDASRLADARAAYERPMPRWLTLRLLTLSFGATGLADETHPAAASVAAALAAYTMQCRLGFIAFGTRMKLDRRLDPTKASTAQLDAAARTLIEALRKVLTAPAV